MFVTCLGMRMFYLVSNKLREALNRDTLYARVWCLKLDLLLVDLRTLHPVVGIKIFTNHASRANITPSAGLMLFHQRIDHLHYDVIRAKPDGSCSRPAEAGPSVSKNGGKQAGKPAGQKRY